MTFERNYKIERGQPWERLVILKDARTRRRVHPTGGFAAIAITSAHKLPITVDLTGERGLMLSLDQWQTWDLVDGAVLPYDVVATFDDLPDRVVQCGTVTIETPSNITPRNEAEAVELRFRQGTDYYEPLTFREEDGTLIEAVDAYAQARNADGDVVLDFRWFATAPTDGELVVLDDERRCYLAPHDGVTLMLHVSDLNPVEAGSYPYDLFIQEASTLRWTMIQAGTVVVEASVSVRP